MESQQNIDLQLMQRATSTENLKERADVNHRYGANDFEAWVDSLLAKVKFSAVLDICCGTGNQLVKYAARDRDSKIVGVDISHKSLAAAEKRLQAAGATRYKLMSVAMEEVFADPTIASERFDLISCFYGLYYSRDVSRTLIQMIEHLSEGGNILIVGPYGSNNSALFNIVQRHFVLPELVIRSSTSFMEREVFPILSENMQISVETFVNTVRYPNAKTLIDYWKASTFFSYEKEQEVVRDIEDHFAQHGHFDMEKHVMAYLARKA